LEGLKTGRLKIALTDRRFWENRILVNGAAALLREALRASWDLFKILVPISILVRLLSQAGVVDYLGVALSPVMTIMGLPGSMGLAWATALVTNLYGGLVVFASLAPDAHLTVAQVTVLSSVILVAHGFPVELSIAHKAGLRFAPLAALRFVGALALGWGLNRIYTRAGLLQRPNVAWWNPPAGDPSWPAWALSEARTLFTIFLILLSLLLLMRVLDRLGVTALLTRLLAPILALLGMSRAAAPITIIGMTLGFSYGGALIIQEARSGRLGRRDVFFSITLMSICHSLIEDPLLMLALGAHLSGTLWARLGFALIVTFLLGSLLRKVPDKTFDRFLCPLAVGNGEEGTA
jgi:hypothetical protein